MHLVADWMETNCHGSEKVLIHTVELGILSKSPALAVMFAREAMKIKTRDVPHGGRDHNHHHHHLHHDNVIVCYGSLVK